MKKLALFVMFAITGSLFLASCSGGDDDTAEKPKPTVTWKTTAGFKFADGTETAGNNISFGILATPSSGEKITRVVINLSVNGGANAILFDSTLKENSFNQDWIDVKLGELAGAKSKFTVTVTQSNDQTASSTFTITASSPARNTQVTANIVLGAQATNTGSFFNPKQGSSGVMTIAAAAADQANTHVVYYMGATNKATFSAPNDAQITGVFSSMSNWKTRNATVFKKTTMTAAQFDAIDPNDASKIDTECSNGVFTSKAAQMAIGDVIAYRTQDGTHYALFKISAISNMGSTNSEITFDMANPAF